MPPKSKKTGLSDAQIQKTLNMVKNYWPEYLITKDDLRNPSREFMLKFYGECAANLDEKCAFVTRSGAVTYPPNLSEEDLLFLKLSRIPTLLQIDFKLGDLYTFDPKRVNHYITILMHFLFYSENVMDKLVGICDQVFNTKESMDENEKKLNELREEKTQKQISLTLAKSENKKLKEVAAMIEPKWKETMALTEQSERDCTNLLLEADKLKAEMEFQQEEIQKHDIIKLQLHKQIVTKEEHDNLKSTLESLTKKYENLEEIDLDNGLLEQKKHIEQLQICIQELNHLELCDDLFKLPDLRMQLKNVQETLRHAVALQQSSETELIQLRIQLEDQKSALQSDNIKLQEALGKLKEDSAVEEMELKMQYEGLVQTNSDEVERLKKEVAQREEDYVRLKNGLQEKYEAILGMQDDALRKFMEFIRKVEEKRDGGK